MMALLFQGKVNHVLLLAFIMIEVTDNFSLKKYLRSKNVFKILT